jgi:hypothetical protein
MSTLTTRPSGQKAAPDVSRAQPKGKTREATAPHPALVFTNVRASGSITVSGVTVGFTAEQVRALIDAATKGKGTNEKKFVEVSRQLGVTQGAMRTMLATVGQAKVPDEELVTKLAEVFEQNRKSRMPSPLCATTTRSPRRTSLTQQRRKTAAIQ